MRITQQMAAGLFFLGFGGLSWWLASGLPMGTAADMGIGYTPRLLAFGCLGVGVLLLIGAMFTRGEGGGISFDLGPLALVTLMVAGFGLLLPWTGLPLAVILSILPAAVSGETFRWPHLLAMAVGLAALTTALFAWGLRLQIPIYPWFMQV